jgi:hypothetical protein
MKDLWRSTVKLLRENPILWVPAICATLCTMGVDQLSRWLARRIFVWTMTGRSVLGFDSPAAGDLYVAQQKALHYMAPVEAILHYVNVCLLVCALAITARLVKMILNDHVPRMADGFVVLREAPRRILWFALKFTACMLAATALGFLLFPNLAKHGRPPGSAGVAVEV